MTLEEKKQIYLDRFPAIIGRRMAEQFSEGESNMATFTLDRLVAYFEDWCKTNEKEDFWCDICNLYSNDETIEHQQILDIFHKHNIKP